jgi:FKBP-type peptidyl-prolyl cis-trans isomerase FkpA
MFQKLFAFAILIIIAASCSKDETVDYGPIDDKIIKDYLAANDLTAESTPSGLYYIILTPGGTIHPTIDNDVKVMYKGYLTDGTVFDQSTYSTNKPATFPLKNLVKGWQEGLPMIGVGGKIQLFIPSELGYGSTAKPGIPASSVLIFDIDLLDFY